MDVFEVPNDGFAQAGGEGFLGGPAQFALQVRGIHGVAFVMAWPVGHEGDQIAVCAEAGVESIE